MDPEDPVPPGTVNAELLRRANTPVLEITIVLEEAVDADTTMDVRWLVVP